MKRNKNIKILLPIVIVVWGILLYKVFDAFSSDDVILAKITKSTFIAPTVQKKDTFSLLEIEKDPFLGTMYDKYKVKQANKNTRPSLKEKVPWPVISYVGIIDDKNSVSSVFVVNINGTQHLLKKGDTIQKIKLINGSKEVVRIRYLGKTKEFSIL